MAHPQPGQNAAFADIPVPQCGHFTKAGGAPAGVLPELVSRLFSKPFSELSSELDNAASNRLRYIDGVAAFFANAVDLESVTRGDVMVLASDLLFNFSDLFREKFDRRTALRAHHVVMVAAVVLMFITRDAIMKRNFAGQSATREQLQSPVDGGESDARVGALNQSMQFVDGEMLTGLEKSPQDGAALFRLLKADALEMAKKDFLGLADTLARDDGLIVNTFLQHVGRRGHR